MKDGKNENIEVDSEDIEDLKPKAPPKKAPLGMRLFTVFRKNDESGISGTGVVVEGAVCATGHCFIHWLTPVPKGSVSLFENIDDFIKVHIGPHPKNATIITFQDGEQMHFGSEPSESSGSSDS